MKKHAFWVCTILSIILLNGCELFFKPEFVGAFVFTDPEYTGSDTIKFTEETINVDTDLVIPGVTSVVGSMRMTIVSFDESKNHIKADITSASGCYTTTGYVYITYSLSGNNLFYTMLHDVYPNPSYYPQAAINGPYAKK